MHVSQVTTQELLSEKYVFIVIQFEIAYSFPNFYGVIIEVWEWISNFITQYVMYVITHPCWYES